MKIKISKSQWTEMGKKAGWMKKASFGSPWNEDRDMPRDMGYRKNKYPVGPDKPVRTMPGQTPYTEDELAKVHQMVGDAAKEDPGETMEGAILREDDNASRRRVVKVTFDDGDTVTTRINGTKNEILKYYLPYGNSGTDQDYDLSHPEKVRHAVKVEFLD